LRSREEPRRIGTEVRRRRRRRVDEVELPVLDVEGAKALYNATAQLAPSWRLGGALFQAGPKLAEGGINKLGGRIGEVFTFEDQAAGINFLEKFGANSIWKRHNRPVAIIWDEIVEGGRPYEHAGWRY